MRFSANLGFLWPELELPAAIHAAKAAGFDAVECHWPYTTPVADVNAALKATGLSMLGLNTVRGDVDKRENGLCALVGREDEARASIEQAIDYAVAINANVVHVMAGFADGPLAHDTFVENLRFASEMATRKSGEKARARTSEKAREKDAQEAAHDVDEHTITLVIEPLNHYDAPGYFLQSTDQALAIIREVGASNVALMFDCYHVQMMEGDLSHRLKTLLPHIGHIQFAGVPARGRPDEGEVNYRYLFDYIDQLGYKQPLGAEYRPGADTDSTLGWMQTLV